MPDSPRFPPDSAPAADPGAVPSTRLYRLEPIEAAAELPAGEYAVERGGDVLRFTLERTASVFAVADAVDAARARCGAPAGSVVRADVRPTPNPTA